MRVFRFPAHQCFEALLGSDSTSTSGPVFTLWPKLLSRFCHPKYVIFVWSLESVFFLCFLVPRFFVSCFLASLFLRVQILPLPPNSWSETSASPPSPTPPTGAPSGGGHPEGQEAREGPALQKAARPQRGAPLREPGLCGRRCG